MAADRADIHRKGNSEQPSGRGRTPSVDDAPTEEAPNPPRGPVRFRVELTTMADGDAPAGEVERLLGHDAQRQRGLPSENRNGTSGSPGQQAAGFSFMLGDFEIIRQVGRGGMGIVYEARQVSLHRRVAVKVLPFVSSLDPQQLQRFRTEAQAAAQLHHANIVPIFSVGSENGIHYYAMQFIEGQSLADLIRDLRRRSDAGPAATEETVLDDSPANGQNPGAVATTANANEATSHVDRSTEIHGGHASGSSSKGQAHFRAVANFGMQAAEALEHAHQLGIIHRDIKPANLLVDTRSNLWVTDFGVARIQDDAGLTRTGDLIGTLRYMSPEQASPSRTVVDHRTDVYSLGVTLYELLTLRPAFAIEDRQDFLRRIAQEEPRPIRKSNPSVPIDLETIVLKAMCKEPAERYASAREFAEDLHRFLELKPIRARRPTIRDRAVKLARRHAVIVSAALVLMMVAVGGLAAALLLIDRERGRATEKEKEAVARAVEAKDRAADLERQLYINRVNRAHAECSAGNVAEAELLLDACPAGHRGWEWNYVKRLCHRELLTYRGHVEGTGYGLAAFSPDGTRVVSAGSGLSDDGSATKALPRGMLAAWDASSGIEHFARRDLKHGVTCLAYSRDGRFIATGTSANRMEKSSGGIFSFPHPEGELTLWDAATGRELYSRPTREFNLTALAFSPDGRLLVAAYGVRREGGEVSCQILETSTGKLLHALPGWRPAISSAAFGPDGRQLAIATADSLELWDVEKRSQTSKITRAGQHFNCVTFSHDGKSIASASDDKTIRIWDLSTGQNSLTLHGHKGEVFTAAFSADGRHIVSGSDDWTVRIWDVRDGDPVAVLTGHTSRVTSVAFSPDGARIVSKEFMGPVKVWLVPTPREFRHSIIASADSLKRVTGIAFSPDGLRLATSCRDNSVRIWEIRSGDEVLAIRKRDSVFPNAVAFSPDGRTIGFAGWDCPARLWDLVTGKEIVTKFGGLDGTYCLAFSPDGKRFASASVEGSIKLWETASGAELMRLPGFTSSFYCVTFSPDGRAVAGGSVRGEVAVWDTSSGNLVLKTSVGTGAIAGVAFTPDGRSLVTASSGAHEEHPELLVWDLASGRQTRRMKGHIGTILCIALSPDGSRVASGGTDGTLRIWGREAGDELLLLRGHGDRINSLAFSPSGLELASGNRDGSVEIWDASPLPPGTSAAEPVDPNLARTAGRPVQPDTAQASPAAEIEVLAHRHFALAWHLACRPDSPSLDVARALQAAQKAVELEPGNAQYWGNLGLAYFRAGDWKEATRAIGKSEDLAAPRHYIENGFILSMIHRKLGNPPEAEAWFDRADRWMSQELFLNTREESSPFRSEAASMLGRKPATSPPGNLPRKD